MSWEPRIYEIERRLNQQTADLNRLRQAVTELGQKLMQAWNQPFGPGGGGGGIALWAKSPSDGIAGSTGVWPELVPTVFSASIYKDVGGTLTLVAEEALVRWWYVDDDDGDRLLPVAANGDGSFDVIASSCTPVAVE